MPAPALPVDYQAVFRQLPENFLLIGADSAATILDDTDSHEQVALTARETAVGRPFFEAYPVGDADGAEQIRHSHQHVREQLAPHVMPLIRYDLRRPDGELEELYWQATHYPIVGEGGELRYLLQRTQNVTEQLRAERAAAEAQRQLAQEQARSRFILDSLPVLVWTATPDGQRDYFNPRWLDFTGRPLAEQLGEGWLQCLHPADQERVRAHWQRSVADGSPYQTEYRLRRPDGQYRWVLSRATPQRDEQGAIVMWVGGVTDIHDQKELMQEVLETSERQAQLAEQSYQNFQQVQQHRQLFYNLLLHAPALICVVRGPEHRYEFANEEFLAMTGEPVLGRTVAEVYPEVVSQGLVQILDRVLETGEPHRGYERPLHLNGPDGQPQTRYYNFVYECFEENGRHAGVTGYAQDVTELVLTRQRLQELPPAAPAPPGPVS